MCNPFLWISYELNKTIRSRPLELENLFSRVVNHSFDLDNSFSRIAIRSIEFLDVKIEGTNSNSKERENELSNSRERIRENRFSIRGNGCTIRYNDCFIIYLSLQGFRRFQNKIACAKFWEREWGKRDYLFVI